MLFAQIDIPIPIPPDVTRPNDWLLIVVVLVGVATGAWAVRQIVSKLDVLNEIAKTLQSIERHGDILDAIATESKSAIGNGRNTNRGARTLCFAATRLIETRFSAEPWASEVLAAIRKASDEFDGH